MTTGEVLKINWTKAQSYYFYCIIFIIGCDLMRVGIIKETKFSWEYLIIRTIAELSQNVLNKKECLHLKDTDNNLISCVRLL